MALQSSARQPPRRATLALILRIPFRYNSTRFGINDIMLFMTESVDVPGPICKWIEDNITLPLKAFQETTDPNGQHLTVPEQLSRTREQYFLSARDLLDDGCGASEIIELISPSLLPEKYL